MTDDLVTWLRAQLDEDARIALGIGSDRRAWTMGGGYPETGGCGSPHPQRRLQRFAGCFLDHSALCTRLAAW